MDVLGEGLKRPIYYSYGVLDDFNGEPVGAPAGHIALNFGRLTFDV